MGASNLAAKRAAKANRRKAIVAQKRKAEAAEGTMAGQVVRSAALPIHDCLIAGNLFDVGMGTLILTRGATVGPVFVAAFLLDTFCGGVNDVTLRSMSAHQLEAYIEVVDDVTPLVPIDPSLARRLLRDIVQWSGSLGFRPHRDFATAERLFGHIAPHAGETTFEFGQGGKPLYMAGPADTRSEARRNIEQLSQQLGPDGFHYIVPG